MNRDTETKDSVIGGFTVINEKTKSKVQNVGELNILILMFIR